MNNIIQLFQQNKQVNECLEFIQNNEFKIHASNTTSHVNKLLAASVFHHLKQDYVFYVAPNIYKAQEAYETIQTLVGADNVSLFPVDELITTELLATSPTFRLERINTIKNIIENKRQIIVTHTVGVLRHLLSKPRWENAIITLKKKEEIDVTTFVDLVVSYGYKKMPSTISQGEFSVRGSIVDIFPFNTDYPYRIELFDIEIESIKQFDPETQFSNKETSTIEIYPVYEIFYDKTLMKEVLESIRKDASVVDEELSKDIRNIENYHDLDRLNRYIKYFDPKSQTILEMVTDKTVIFDDFNEIKENYSQAFFDLGEYLSHKHQAVKVKHFYFEPLESMLGLSTKQIYLSEFTKTLNNIKLTNLIDMQAVGVIDYNNNVKNFIADLKNSKLDKTYVVCATDKQKRVYFEELFSTHEVEYIYASSWKDVKKQTVYLVECENAISFAFLKDKLVVMTAQEIYDKNIKHKTKFKMLYQDTIKISSKEELSTGDYVVHQDYGIGKYLGIKTIDLKNVKNDYIEMMYDDEKILYIPVENIHMLEKYVGSEASVPKLTKLGTKEWQKKKEKIQQKLEDIADQLIEIQAAREAMIGYSYGPDSEYQHEFESDFEFVETLDQEKAITEVKKDMESRYPMDRLICGDVGFGKTEIAMRAAFKAIENGKQVAYLAPTTVLTRQHYYTFKHRFEKFGMRIELLNRFVDQRVQKQTIQGLAKGVVDVVIGTHRLLSKDIRFKDLGLLIIDEEQRFGVEHKEQIKNMKHNIDVLSLSATPIPRTLQMSLMGIRDMSLLETPPTNRYPIQTYVVEANDVIIREAIYREMSRGGQVFYLHNRISGLDKIYKKVTHLVPSSKVAVIHGRMSKDEIEDVMQSFIDKIYDVLICTTIIETGVDIPNANTLIIDDADKLGLAQIYQIRGRVGRSDKIAYAYLMYQPAKVLTETSQKRLEAIKEFTALGSGYKIAVRDLTIRGAGDILGKEQSGFIDAIGIDLYMKMLHDAVRKKKGTYVPETESKKFNVEVSKHIPNQYVSDDSIKIEIHKRIATITSREIQNSIVDEFTNRFGRLSEDVLLYIEEKYLEHLLKAKGIEAYTELVDRVNLNFSIERSQKISGEKLFQIGTKISSKIKFDYKTRRIFITFYKNDFKTHYIYVLTKLLESI